MELGMRAFDPPRPRCKVWHGWTTTCQHPLARCAHLAAAGSNGSSNTPAVPQGIPVSPPARQRSRAVLVHTCPCGRLRLTHNGKPHVPTNNHLCSEA